MSLVLDAGALIAVDRGDRYLHALLKRELAEGHAPLTHGGVVGQAWRGARQARLAQLLGSLDVRPLDEALWRESGVLLARARRADVIDAALVLLAADGDQVLTSDPGDLVPLAAAAGLHVDVVRV
jgi:hypothetical protein